MAQDLSIEDKETVFFTTSRTIGSRLWFINNPQLEDRILAYLAKYSTIYGVILYGFKLMGNHYHLKAAYPNANRAEFLRALNSMIARLTILLAPGHDGGKVWARRARSQFLLNSEDLENWFFYSALNAVSSGLARRISDDAQYNSFSDAISGRVRSFKVVNWEDYNNRIRFNPKLTIEECTETYELRFERLPGYEELSHKQYQSMMLGKLEERRQRIIKERTDAGLGFATTEQLRATKPGSKPRTTKTSTRYSPRPLCLTLCKESKERFLSWYFDLLARFRAASEKFRRGDLMVEFPPGTYRPPNAVALA